MSCNKFVYYGYNMPYPHIYKSTHSYTMNKTLILSFAFIALLATAGNAQKFGYCNSSVLLSELPEVKAADSDLKDFQTQLTKRGQEMVKSLQDKSAELERKKEIGTIAPKDYDVQSAKLAEEEEKIKAYEQEVYTKLGQKREDLFKPILDKVNKMMQEVAIENKFTYVFDSSTQVIVYADESLDVTKLVKAKLGVN